MKNNSILLVVRIIVGGLFIMAGWMKISTMTAEMGTIAQFASMGIPAFLAYAVAYLEFIGGILIVLGLFVPCASAILSIIMVVATYYSYKAFGSQALMGPLFALASLLGLVVSGAGKYAIPCKKKTVLSA